MIDADMEVFAKLISGEEGLRLRVYDDATGKYVVPGYKMVGHPSIGWGRALDTNGVTESEAAFLRQADILSCKSRCDDQFPWFEHLCVPRQAVIVSMVFNLGMDGFKLFTKLIDAVERGDFGEAAAQMSSSHWASQVPVRANQLTQIMFTGQVC